MRRFTERLEAGRRQQRQRRQKWNGGGPPRRQPRQPRPRQPPAAASPAAPGLRYVLVSLDGEDPAPYAEWLVSVKEFADILISRRGSGPDRGGSGGVRG